MYNGSKKEMILTIGITSYNRVDELIRCLRSVDCNEYIDNIEIIISEDNSPLRDKIEKAVIEFAEKSKYRIIFHKNEKNLGYDRNLKKLIELANGKYILYVSDDDMFLPCKLSHVLKVLTENDYGFYYSSNYNTEKGRYSKQYDSSYKIDSGAEYARAHIYDSILFSGLIFRVEYVRGLDAERFLNKNYFQVYMFLYSLYKYGGYYDKEPLINAIGDGANGYGQADSAVKSELLANRKHVLSNLEFHKGLIDVIRMAGDDLGVDFISSFEREYSKRSVVGIVSAAKAGRKTLRQYWTKMKSLNIRLTNIAYVYYVFIMIVGGNIAEKLMQIAKKSNVVKGQKYD